MKIINKTKATLLADRVSFAESFLERAVGLLNRSGLKDKEALVIKPCNSVHTFLMRFTIDVLFVDKNNCVVKTVTSLKPFRITGVYFNSAYVLELPTNAIRSTLTEKNDIIALE